jgi:hypothetical protein
LCSSLNRPCSTPMFIWKCFAFSMTNLLQSLCLRAQEPAFNFYRNSRSYTHQIYGQLFSLQHAGFTEPSYSEWRRICGHTFLWLCTSSISASLSSCLSGMVM